MIHTILVLMETAKSEDVFNDDTSDTCECATTCILDHACIGEILGTCISLNRHVSSGKDEEQMLALFDLHNLGDAGECEE